MPGSTDEQQHDSTDPDPGQESEPPGIDPGGVDAEDEPSAGWGWHGSFPVGGRVMGWLTAVLLFGMAFFSHADISGTWWLVVVAAGLTAMLIGHEFRRSRSWRH